MTTALPETHLGRTDPLVATIQAALDRYWQTADGCPDPLREAIRYSLLSPGKRLRPRLVVFAAQACGGTLQAALPAACAVEMVHTYSLIHDDLPAMDDDDLRRGRPTCHKKFGEALAILAGDALLARSFEILAREVQPPALAARCCAQLGWAAGATALVGGQVADLASEGKTGELAQLESIHRRKTGALFLVSLRLGGIVGGGDAEALEALEVYGRNLGLAFQITDDLLDVSGDEDAVGKRVGRDCQLGKLTFPALLGVEESRRRAAAMVQQATDALAPLAATAQPLIALARFVLTRNR